MGQDDIARIFAKLDQLGADVAGLKADATAQAKLLEEVRADVKILSRQGCARGEMHEDELRELRDAPGRALAAAGVVAGLISSIVGGLVWLVNHAE